jgi:hypothetical protein
VLLGECLGGALYIQDFIRLCREVGFLDPRQLSIEPIEVGWAGCCREAQLCDQRLRPSRPSGSRMAGWLSCWARQSCSAPAVSSLNPAAAPA